MERHAEWKICLTNSSFYAVLWKTLQNFSLIFCFTFIVKLKDPLEPHLPPRLRWVRHYHAGQTLPAVITPCITTNHPYHHHPSPPSWPYHHRSLHPSQFSGINHYSAPVINNTKAALHASQHTQHSAAPHNTVIAHTHENRIPCICLPNNCCLEI